MSNDDVILYITMFLTLIMVIGMTRRLIIFLLTLWGFLDEK